MNLVYFNNTEFSIIPNFVYFNNNFKRNISTNSFDKRHNSNISELTLSSNNSFYNSLKSENHNKNILTLNDNELSNKKNLFKHQ